MQNTEIINCHPLQVVWIARQYSEVVNKLTIFLDSLGYVVAKKGKPSSLLTVVQSKDFEQKPHLLLFSYVLKKMGISPFFLFCI